MTELFIFVAQAFAVLLLAAMVVAAWEQWCANQAVWSSIHGGSPTGPLEPSPTHADAADAALARMTRPGSAPAPTRRNDPSWAETRPMIGGGTGAAPVPTSPSTESAQGGGLAGDANGGGPRVGGGSQPASTHDLDLPLS
jgi:hypothetical protein